MELRGFGRTAAICSNLECQSLQTSLILNMTYKMCKRPMMIFIMFSKESYIHCRSFRFKTLFQHVFRQSVMMF